MTIPIMVDEVWDSDSAYLRFNLKHSLDADGREAFEEALHDWMQSGVEGVLSETPLHYLDDEFDWYDGPLGKWVQAFVDFGANAPNETDPIFATMLSAIEPFDVVESVQVGSGYASAEAGWPYPPEPVD